MTDFLTIPPGMTVEFTPPPELVLCRDADQAREVRGQVRHLGHITVLDAQYISARQLSGRSYQRVTIASGVDDRQDVGGCGPLLALVHQRMRTYGNAALLVRL